MILTLTNRKYLKPYNGVGKPTRWQTEAVAEDIVALLSAYAIRCEIHSDDDWSLISWATSKMQLWIGIECVDTSAPTFQLDIGAGKRVMLIFGRSFPDSVFADEPWMLQLKKLTSGEQRQ